MELRQRPLTRSKWRLVTGLAILLGCACAPPPRPLPPRILGSVSGDWTGRTSEGRAIAFTVSRNQRIVAVTLEYAHGGCSGTVIIPANVPLFYTADQAAATVVSSSNGQPGPGPIAVRFLFLSTRNASGTATFPNDPACRGTSATWTAAR